MRRRILPGALLMFQAAGAWADGIGISLRSDEGSFACDSELCLSNQFEPQAVADAVRAAAVEVMERHFSYWHFARTPQGADAVLEIELKKAMGKISLRLRGYSRAAWVDDLPISRVAKGTQWTVPVKSGLERLVAANWGEIFQALKSVPVGTDVALPPGRPRGPILGTVAVRGLPADRELMGTDGFEIRARASGKFVYLYSTRTGAVVKDAAGKRHGVEIYVKKYCSWKDEPCRRRAFEEYETIARCEFDLSPKLGQVTPVAVVIYDIPPRTRRAP